MTTLPLTVHLRSFKSGFNNWIYPFSNAVNNSQTFWGHSCFQFYRVKRKYSFPPQTFTAYFTTHCNHDTVQALAGNPFMFSSRQSEHLVFCGGLFIENTQRWRLKSKRQSHSSAPQTNRSDWIKNNQDCRDWCWWASYNLQHVECVKAAVTEVSLILKWCCC